MLQLYKPKLKELSYRQALLADKDTMSYNEKWGGAITFPQENWESWYKQWILSDERQYYYRYLFAESLQRFVGEIAYHYDTTEQAYIANIIIEAKYRNAGYGKKGLSLLMEAAKANGIPKLCDTIAIDNPGIALFLKTGFSELWRNENYIMVELVL